MLAKRWPILHYGDPPDFDPATWDLAIHGLVNNPIRLDWNAFQRLPRTTVTGDLHCVTRWSLVDNAWGGVLATAIVDLVKPGPDARFVLLRAAGEYMANIPRAAFLDEGVILATERNGEPLNLEHGGPVRIVAPARYGWKSVKWLREIEFVRDDVPGFWEGFGYSNDADPWKEERFAEE